MSNLTNKEIKEKRTKKSTEWVITAAVKTRYDIEFNKPLTADQAREAFIKGHIKATRYVKELEVGHVISVGLTED